MSTISNLNYESKKTTRIKFNVFSKRKIRKEKSQPDKKVSRINR